MSKSILRQIITQCAGTHDIFKKLSSCDPCGGKSGLTTFAFLLCLSIYGPVPGPNRDSLRRVGGGEGGESTHDMF